MVRDELLEIEREGWDSLCDGTGADFYGRVMTDEHRVGGEGRLALYQQTPAKG